MHTDASGSKSRSRHVSSDVEAHSRALQCGRQRWKHSPRRVVVGMRGVRISNLPPWLSLLCMVIYIKEEPAMQISVSSTLTVYHDGQFWVGLAEHVEDGRYGAARIVFGAEPSNEEILRFVVNK